MQLDPLFEDESDHDDHTVGANNLGPAASLLLMLFMISAELSRRKGLVLRVTIVRSPEGTLLVVGTDVEIGKNDGSLMGLLL